MPSFHINHSHAHLKWDNELKPVHTVDSGTIITYDLLDGGNNQINAQSTVSDVVNFNFSLGNPVFGPVFINGARPGDVLKVEILALQPGAYGWTAIFPGFGLLSDEFPAHALQLWDVESTRDRGYLEFPGRPGIRVPLRPFLGIAGVARARPGQWSTIPPYETGGNIDCRHVSVGSALFLPVEVEGALFSCGDGHAAQGDGEVCGTAIECPMQATLRLTVEKAMPWVKSPHYLSPPQPAAAAAIAAEMAKGEYAAVGIHEDLREASRVALRSLMDWLVATKGLDRVEAYMLASVAADLKIVEAVDMPHYAVACALPLSVFVDE